MTKERTLWERHVQMRIKADPTGDPRTQLP